MGTVTLLSPEEIPDFVTIPDYLTVNYLQGLSKSERGELFDKLRRLRTIPEEDWEDQDAIPWGGAEGENLYMIPFTPSYRAFVLVEPDGKFAIDMVTTTQMLDFFQRQHTTNGKA